jgi:5-formyltetrahydrofolate cyclo-ligase
MKAALRASVLSAVRGLRDDAVAAQSVAVCERVAALQSFWMCRSVSVFLSKPAGELRTHTLLETCFATGKDVYVPKVRLSSVRGARAALCPPVEPLSLRCIRRRLQVLGRARDQMVMVRVRSMADIAAFPVNAWGIPEPADTHCTDVVDGDGDACPLDLIVMPGAAFDAKGARLGYGKGFYGGSPRRRCDSGAELCRGRESCVDAAFADSHTQTTRAVTRFTAALTTAVVAQIRICSASTKELASCQSCWWVL